MERRYANQLEIKPVDKLARKKYKQRPTETFNGDSDELNGLLQKEPTTKMNSNYADSQIENGNETLRQKQTNGGILSQKGTWTQWPQYQLEDSHQTW